MSTGSTARQAHELDRRQHRHVAVGPRSDPDDRAREQRPLDEDRHAGRERERRHAARLERPSQRRPRAAEPRGRPQHRRPWRPSPRPPAGRRARARPPAGRRTRRRATSRSARASQPAASAAACADRRARFELLEPRLRARRAQEDGDALDGLGPGHRPILRAAAISRGAGSAATAHAVDRRRTRRRPRRAAAPRAEPSSPRGRRGRPVRTSAGTLANSA